MGIKNMVKLITRYSPKAIKDITIDKLKNKIVAIDANLFIYKSIFAIRGSMGKDMTTKIKFVEKKTTHLYIMFIRLYGLYKWGIKPVFVFDSAYHQMKEQCIIDRANKKKEYKRKYLIAKDEKMKKKYYHLCQAVTGEEYDDIIKLIRFFGFSHIFSHEEADSQCAYMSKKGIVDYVISDDSDLLMFGCKNIIKGFTLNVKKKMKIIELQSILKETKLPIKSFIHLGILLGSDYIDTIPGIGYVKAYNLIQEYKTIDIAQKYDIIPNNYDYKPVYNYFVKSVHKIIKKSDIKNIPPNKEGLKEFMFENGFSRSQIINKYIDILTGFTYKN